MIDSGLSMCSIGMEICCREPRNLMGLRKFSQACCRAPKHAKSGPRPVHYHPLMPRISVLFVSFALAIPAFADFRLESVRGRFASNDGDVHTMLVVTNNTLFAAENVQISYSDFSQHISPVPLTDWTCTALPSVTCKLAYAIPAGESRSVD